MKANLVKEKLAAGEVVIGSFVYIPSAKLTEIISLIGLDFVVVDMEHGPVDTETAEHMIRAAQWAGVTPILRVTHNTRHLILRALDSGAQGVHVPEINTLEDAKAMVASMKYGPEGQRGLAGVRAANYGLGAPLAAYTARANQELLSIAHIESHEAVANLDDLLALDGIDIYYLGPVDLSNSLGIPGQTRDPRVIRLVEEAITRIVAAGKVAGCIAADTATARRYTDLGVRYLATHAIKFMVNGTRQFMEEVRL